MNEKTSPLGAWNYCSSSALKRASRQLSQLYKDVLAPSGLTITQYALLSQIKLGGATPLKLLAKTMVMDLSALGHTLKPLQRDGLVELISDDRDRRVKRVRLSDKGEQLWHEAHSLWLDAQARFDAAFGKEASDNLRRTMDLLASPAFATAFNAARPVEE